MFSNKKKVYIMIGVRREILFISYTALALNQIWQFPLSSNDDNHQSPKGK